MDWGCCSASPGREQTEEVSHIPGWILCEVEALSLGWGSLEEDTLLKECQPDAGQDGLYLLPWAKTPSLVLGRSCMDPWSHFPGCAAGEGREKGASTDPLR